VCRLLYDQTERYRNLSVQPARQRKRDVGKEHKRLMEAAIARDGDALCKLIDAHFRETTQLILDSGSADGDSVSGRKPSRAKGPAGAG